MNKQIYTITELSEELNQVRQNVRRRVIKLGIKAINEDSREYKTDPLKYNNHALIQLAKDFGVILRTSNSITNEQASSTIEQVEFDLIKILKEQLKHEREQNDRLSKINDNLLNQLDKSQSLLDQQQQLSLSDKNKIKVLELKLEEIKEPVVTFESKSEHEKNHEAKWYDIFKIRKK